LQAFGGLNVAFILRYADNILKGFAAAFSTIASCLVEVVWFGFQPTIPFLLGGLLINVAVFLYNTPGGTPPSSNKNKSGSGGKGGEKESTSPDPNSPRKSPSHANSGSKNADMV
jgi:hypothetical protein